ncbi:hypothetical protein JT359_08675 [Candidatus Poribacteria bacterium]|nr:hypothetical protein [Candidatus Poribacteria bacterium]
MKQKFFTLGIIALLAVVCLFVFQHVTSAQRPDRNDQSERGQRGNRGGGERGGGSMMGNFNPSSFIDNSWLDLTFAIKVDDETLIEARTVHQEARDMIAEKMKGMAKMREAGDFQGMMQEMRTISTSAIKDLQTGLKEVLSEDQMKQLTESMKKRAEDAAERRNRFRGRQQGGEDGQRGQGRRELRDTP